jgi:ribosomal protein L12E/L44/L45/RPP1/RPP2
MSLEQVFLRIIEFKITKIIKYAGNEKEKGKGKEREKRRRKKREEKREEKKREEETICKLIVNLKTRFER